jgi:DNA polymerase III epsilon subunit-like protein
MRTERHVYVGFDLETTGLDPLRHGICEIGAVATSSRGEIVGRFREDCNPGLEFGIEVDPSALAVNKFTLDRIEDAPYIGSVLTRFFTFLHDLRDQPVIVSQNSPFDTGFMLAAMRRERMDIAEIGRPFRRGLDTISIAFATLGDGLLHSQSSLSKVMGFPPDPRAHTAEADAERCIMLFHALSDMNERRRKKI